MVNILQAFEKKGFQVFASKISVIIIQARKILDKLFCLFNTDKLYLYKYIGPNSFTYICVVIRAIKQW